MSSLRFNSPLLSLIVDVGFCPAHAAPTCRVNRDTPSISRQNAEITLCFGKPTCTSCYSDYICEPPCSNEEHKKSFFSWNSCECRQSLFCDNCFHEAKQDNRSFCPSCNIMIDEHVKYYCSECEGTTENLSDEDDDAPLSDEEIHEFYVNTVDWTAVKAFEELEIPPTSRLGRLIIGFLAVDKVAPVLLFKILDTVLGDDPALLHLLTSVPGSDDIEDFGSVHNGDEKENHEDWMIINPGVLDKLVSELDVTN